MTFGPIRIAALTAVLTAIAGSAHALEVRFSSAADIPRERINGVEDVSETQDAFFIPRGEPTRPPLRDRLMWESHDSQDAFLIEASDRIEDVYTGLAQDKVEDRWEDHFIVEPD